MPHICPVCKNEFNIEISDCPYCGANWVVAMKSMFGKKDSDEWIDPSSEEAIDYASKILGVSPYVAGRRISIAIEKKAIDSYMPFNEFHQFLTTPQRPRRSKKDGASAVWSFALGIFSLLAWLYPLCGFPVSGIGFALGSSSLKSSKRTLAIAGMVISTVGIVLTSVNSLFGAYLGMIGQYPYRPPAIVAQANTPRPKPTSTTAARVVTKVNCLHWSQVSAKMKGQSTCVYGYVNDHFENFQAQATYFYFGTHDQFFLVSSYRWRENLEKTCISANGTVELNSYGVPYIKVFDNLLTCP